MLIVCIGDGGGTERTLQSYSCISVPGNSCLSDDSNRSIAVKLSCLNIIKI